MTDAKPKRRWFRFSVLMLLAMAAGPGTVNQAAWADEPESLAERQKYWQARLADTNDSQYTHNKDCRYTYKLKNALESLIDFRADCTAHIIADGRGQALTFKFMKGDKELVSVAGHRKSVFGAQNNILFFVDYDLCGPGATVIAYDLNTGKQLWQTVLKALGVSSHSAYGNEVSLEVPDNADQFSREIFIAGHESMGNYVEILDSNTGQLIAHEAARLSGHGDVK